MKVKKSSIFIFLGLLFIVAAFFIAWNNVCESVRAEHMAQEIVTQIKQQIPEQPDIPVPNEYPEREMPTIELDGYNYIGTLDIPSLELSLPVMEEWDNSRLKISPCRYAGSFYRNNMVIAGHNYARHFSMLKKLPIESEIMFTDVEGNVYIYKVAWTEILEPEQVEEMTNKTGDAASDWDLTLFTCTTGGGERYTLRCVRCEDMIEID